MILAVHVARQLWIQLRLLGLLLLPAAAAIVAVIINNRDGPEAAHLALALGLALAAVLSAVLVGTGFAAEIGSGAAAWLVVRTVSRATLIGAWLWLPTVVMLFAFTMAGILGVLAVPSLLIPAPDPVAAAVAILAAAAPVVPMTAAALAIGADASSRVTAVAVLGAAAVIAVPILLMGDSVVHPASGYWLVAGSVPGDLPIAVGLQAIGLCLVLAAGAWGVAAWRFRRRDL